MAERSPLNSNVANHSGNAPESASRSAVRVIAYVALAGAVAAVVYSEMRSRQDRAAFKSQEERLLAQRGITSSSERQLSPEYTDAKNRLVADPPSDPAALLDPATIVLAHYVDTEADVQPVDWKGFQEHLARATDKEVVVREYWNSPDDVAGLKTGDIHIVALHSADTPYLVNNAGLVPVAVLGTETGATGNRMNIAVPAQSGIKSLADIRGHKLTCTRPDSITGYRAAIAVLMQEANLRPDTDYTVHFSYGQKESALGLIAGRYQVAALSDDKVQSLLKSGKINENDFRIIYQSEVIPRVTLGYVYNLKPELAQKIAAATTAFTNQSGPTEEFTSKPMRFQSIDYKKDFPFVRKIDSSFDPRIRKRVPVETAAANEP